MARCPLLLEKVAVGWCHAHGEVPPHLRNVTASNPALEKARGGGEECRNERARRARIG
jgi:hypothetical protein